MIARTYKYMADTYSRYVMSLQTRALMDVWDILYPPEAWECARAQRIEAIQGNSNHVVKARCQEVRLWN